MVVLIKADDPVVESTTRTAVTSPARPLGKQYSWTEVERHRTRDDCWVVVEDRVYDVTKFVARHPGGEHMIVLGSGRDATGLFRSYHKLSTWPVLDKYLIGYIAAGKGTVDAPRHRYPIFKGDLTFYETLKGRVEGWFRDNDADPRHSTELYVKAAVCVSLYAATLFALLYWPGLNALSWTTILGLGVLHALVSASINLNITHDANHGSFSRSQRVIFWCELLMNCIGINSFSWRHQHNVGHHQYTNVPGLDPDVQAGDPDVLRFNESRPWLKRYDGQHLYASALYAMVSLRWRIVDLWSVLTEKSLGGVEYGELTTRDWALGVGGKVFYATTWFVLPFYVGAGGGVGGELRWWQMLALHLLIDMIEGLYVTLVFTVAHLAEATPAPAIDPATNVSQDDWASAQARATTNFAPKSKLWNIMLGGLNQQVEHHLFPSIAHTYYPYLSDIVRDTCAEFDVPYNSCDSFYAAIRDHFDFLHKLGSASLNDPEAIAVKAAKEE